MGFIDFLMRWIYYIYINVVSSILFVEIWHHKTKQYFKIIVFILNTIRVYYTFFILKKVMGVCYNK